MANKIVKGHVGNITIEEEIINYLPNISEQELTARKNIKHKFEQLGYDTNNITFD